MVKSKKHDREIWAVDFDGTLYGYHDGEEHAHWNEPLVEFLAGKQAKGDYIILWTCRTGEPLDAAIKLLEEETPLRLDAVNDNIGLIKDKWRQHGVEPPRKIYANHYIDDKFFAGFDMFENSSRIGWQ